METVAWKHEETRRSFQRYWRFAWLWAGCGAVGTVGCPWIGVIADQAGVKWLGTLMADLWVVSLSALLFGACWVYNAARMRHRLRRWPWKSYPVTALAPHMGGPVMQLRPPDSGLVFVQSVVGLNHRWHLVVGSDTLWFCGTPGRGGVLAQPGGEPLLWGRRIRIPWLRRWWQRRQNVDPLWWAHEPHF